ncbi:DUF1772 domain-containing protein [Streptomyces sp. NPDC048416]|uniref:anthrone oxygenase family protein n=1 Tax=Streptomyces sp. NPDC048416 TaxID=3365546 RepID=UPI00371316AE
METARWATLIAATVTMGLVSGLFYGFAVAVMPGLRRTGDLTVIEVMQRINTAILNGWFLLGYLGAFLFTGVALALHIPSDGRDVLPALVGAQLCCGASMAITGRVNIPLNNALQEAGPAALIGDPAAVRTAFEGPWVRANIWRALLSTAAVGFLAWSLYLEGVAS